MNKNTSNPMKPALIIDTLATMTRDQLRATCERLGVKKGKEKSDCITNITMAISEGKARFTVQFTIRPNGDPAAKFSPAVFSKKLRTHKADKVIVDSIPKTA